MDTLLNPLITGCRRSQPDRLFDQHVQYAKQSFRLQYKKLRMLIPDLERLETATAINNTPLWFGEWAISTNFPATDEFMKKWADAQKLMYSQSAGWIVSPACTSGGRNGVC